MASELTEHGAILEKARGERLSKRAAAEAAGISESRWRQIVSGKQTAGGVRVPVSTKPKTLAAMAHAVGADVREVLSAAGMDPDLADQFPQPIPDSPPAFTWSDFDGLGPRLDAMQNQIDELLERVVDLEGVDRHDSAAANTIPLRAVASSGEPGEKQHDDEAAETDQIAADEAAEHDDAVAEMNRRLAEKKRDK